MLDLSGSQVAEANAKVMEWSSFQMDPTFERSSFTGADGTFFNALQLSSYGESDSMSCAQIVNGWGGKRAGCFRFNEIFRYEIKRKK